MIHLANLAPPAPAPRTPASPARSRQADPPPSNDQSQASKSTSSVSQERRPGEGEPKPTAKSAAPDKGKFGDALSRAWQHQEETPAPILRNLKVALTSLTGVPAPKTPSNDSSQPAVTVPVSTPDNSNPLPLCFTMPAALNAQLQGSSKAGGQTASQGVSQTVGGVDGKSDAPETLQVDRPSAFVARIKPVDESPETLAGEDNGSSAPAALKPEQGSTAFSAPDASLLAAVAPNAMAAPHVSTAYAHNAPAAIAGAAAPHAVVETQAATTVSRPEPLHNISIQVPGARGVEVRLSDQGGEIRVDVRSADPALTQNLRGNLHDLVSGLEHKGFTAQVSHAGQTSSGDNADSNSAKQQSPDQQGQGSGRRHPNQDDPEQPNDPRSPRSAPAWTAAFNANFENSNFETRPQ